jgi:hypothetical protein
MASRSEKRKQVVIQEILDRIESIVSKKKEQVNAAAVTGDNYRVFGRLFPNLFLLVQKKVDQIKRVCGFISTDVLDHD